MFERYTDAAKRAIFFAHVEANHRDQPCISAADILLGLIRENELPLGAVTLRSMVVRLRGELQIPHLPTTSFPYLRKRDIPLDDASKKTLAYAAKEADRDRQYWIDVFHLLRGLLRFPNIAADTLHKAGITLELVRSSAAIHVLQCPPKPAPKWARLKLVASRYPRLLFWLALLVAVAVFALLLRLRGPI